MSVHVAIQRSHVVTLCEVLVSVVSETAAPGRVEAVSVDVVVHMPAQVLVIVLHEDGNLGIHVSPLVVSVKYTL